MKAGVILLSLLAAASAWWWLNRAPSHSGRKPSPRLHGLVRGAAIGVGVYVVLTLGALVYLAATSHG